MMTFISSLQPVWNDSSVTVSETYDCDGTCYWTHRTTTVSSFGANAPPPVVTTVNICAPKAPGEGCILSGPTSSSQFRPGVRSLFSAGVCTSCHSGQGPGVARYVACESCHSTNVSATAAAYPDWLNFTPSDGSSAFVTRSSYYVPGYTKGEASLRRATDGSMPPGASLSTQVVRTDCTSFVGEAACMQQDGCVFNASIGQCNVPVGWCDEMQTAVSNWISAGYPNF